jgi:hypothetical protein
MSGMHAEVKLKMTLMQEMDANIMLKSEPVMTVHRNAVHAKQFMCSIVTSGSFQFACMHTCNRFAGTWLPGAQESLLCC